MERLRQIVLFYTSHFYTVDYALILFVFFLFVCILFLCVFLRHRPIIALMVIAFDIIACVFVYIYGYRFIDFEVRKREIFISQQRIIPSTGALILDFDIKNTSKHDFNECSVVAKIYKDSNSTDFVQVYKDKFIAYRKKSVNLKELKKNASKPQRISFENFNPEGNYSLKISSECF
ncbi:MULTISPECIES: DUF2393 family protein [unclassified Campylobacter]|uniref:DUF2393 family protein n=1 Tax=unclassified Campylobacter TaxID=2593542 RepID=UPI001237B7C6|nr:MULTISPECIES: DUF2393 family protein [unclassified Campylobacter]KAA6225174.1 DUF2393 domain-containing protein [Campylobacter sp. LR196d]KAA6226186.1 DUF2393 domain-containing protein [Campylobacter sp. LR185c]KAA6229014.1 DUF2393 domain-containing protein [Campylobacter sp. LR286c]KAA6231387.1 DUF2393 domain-containing protein [Campylobacter sp. LR264d]KAA6231599.1 DUF2393 domain-containing protein [Campylobacter sp. LR291e]